MLRALCSLPNKEIFKSVRILDRDSYLRIVCAPASSFSAPPSSPPSWIFYWDCAFGDSTSGDYADCAKTAVVHAYLHEAPTDLQETIRQALTADTYVDDGGVGADSKATLTNLLDKISKLLGKSGFQVKSWKCSSQEGTSKYQGMTCNRKDDHYLLKFRLDLQKKMRGMPSGENLDSKFLQDKTTPITKKNVHSIDGQFYDPPGLAAPLMVPDRSMLGPLSADRADTFRFAVEEILKLKIYLFPVNLFSTT